MKRSPPPRRKTPLRSRSIAKRARPEIPDAATQRGEGRGNLPRNTAQTPHNSTLQPTTTSGTTRSEPLRRTTRLSRNTATKRGPARDADEADAFKEGVRDRARGRCEACPRLRAAASMPRPDEISERRWARLVDDACRIARDCKGSGCHSHHIKPRGMGGHADHSLDNGLYTCDAAHRFVHQRGVALAYVAGLLRRHG